MDNETISITVRECDYSLPFRLYKTICESPQVDHILREGNQYNIWSNDGQHWKVTIKPD